MGIGNLKGGDAQMGVTEKIENHERRITKLEEITVEHNSRIAKLEDLMKDVTDILNNQSKLEEKLVNAMVEMTRSQNKMIWKIVLIVGGMVSIISIFLSHVL